jgi:hypothetical protein
MVRWMEDFPICPFFEAKDRTCIISILLFPFLTFNSLKCNKVVCDHNIKKKLEWIVKKYYEIKHITDKKYEEEE